MYIHVYIFHPTNIPEHYENAFIQLRRWINTNCWLTSSSYTHTTVHLAPKPAVTCTEYMDYHLILLVASSEQGSAVVTK